jgi:hypothetical protein
LSVRLKTSLKDKPIAASIGSTFAFISGLTLMCIPLERVSGIIYHLAIIIHKITTNVNMKIFPRSLFRASRAASQRAAYPDTKLIIIDTLERVRDTEFDKNIYACIIWLFTSYLHISDVCLHDSGL